jgi:hypothetical protein
MAASIISDKKNTTSARTSLPSRGDGRKLFVSEVGGYLFQSPRVAMRGRTGYAICATPNARLICVRTPMSGALAADAFLPRMPNDLATAVHGACLLFLWGFDRSKSAEGWCALRHITSRMGTATNATETLPHELYT